MEDIHSSISCCLSDNSGSSDLDSPASVYTPEPNIHRLLPLPQGFCVGPNKPLSSAWPQLHAGVFKQCVLRRGSLRASTEKILTRCFQWTVTTCSGWVWWPLGLTYQQNPTKVQTLIGQGPVVEKPMSSVWILGAGSIYDICTQCVAPNIFPQSSGSTKGLQLF